MSAIVSYTPGMEPLGSAAVALGVFDGVHVGHQTLIADAIRLARSGGQRSCIVTFDRDPDQVVTPGQAAPQLTRVQDKLALIADLGPDTVLVLPFDAALAAVEPEPFVEDVLLGVLRPAAVVVGEDFRFGARARGDVATLRACGERDGFTVVAHELVTREGAPVTSTRIRRLVAEGHVDTAARLLGRPHRLHGSVEHGKARGHLLGVPTANLAFDKRLALPGPGVYAALCESPEGTYAAAVSVGLPPSFSDATSVFEVHLIDFDGDLYGRTLAVDFIERVRDQRRFPDQAELSRAINADIESVRRLIG